jgi:hypothetical protein
MIPQTDHVPATQGFRQPFQGQLRAITALAFNPHALIGDAGNLFALVLTRSCTTAATRSTARTVGVRVARIFATWTSRACRRDADPASDTRLHSCLSSRAARRAAGHSAAQRGYDDKRESHADGYNNCPYGTHGRALPLDASTTR